MKKKATSKTPARPAPKKPSQPNVIMLEPGELKVGNSRTGKVHKFDVLEVQLTIEEVEARHQLKRDEAGHMRPTAEFLQDVATAIDSLGFDGCDKSQAFQIWIATAMEMLAVQKRMLDVRFA